MNKQIIMYIVLFIVIMFLAYYFRERPIKMIKNELAIINKKEFLNEIKSFVLRKNKYSNEFELSLYLGNVDKEFKNKDIEKLLEEAKKWYNENKELINKLNK